MLPILVALTLAGTSPLPESGTDQDFTAWAVEIAAGLNRGDAAALDGRLDLPKIAERSIDGIKAPKELRDGFIQGARKGSSPSIGQSVVTAVQQNGAVRFLRVHLVDGKKRALFRLTTDGGLNYFEV